MQCALIKLENYSDSETLFIKLMQMLIGLVCQIFGLITLVPIGALKQKLVHIFNISHYYFGHREIIGSKKLNIIYIAT